MSEFFEYDVPDVESKYRILVWPNITYSEDLEKDSYVVVLSNVIREVNKLVPGIFWSIVTPKEVKSLKFPNTEQLILDFPTYPNSMRINFDFKKVMNLVDWRKNDYDIVYSHLPEHTLQLSNLFNNQTNIRPKFIGYCHWYEVDENTAYSKNVFMNNIAGTLEMQECGVNSVWLKDLILKKSAKFYSESVLEDLERILQPHYLGTDADVGDNTNLIPRSILFNHRPNEYTGWNEFLKSMDQLYEKRQDFTVYVTLAEEERPYIKKVCLNRKEYTNFLKQMHVGVGFFKDYSAWSISATDGMSRGLPYLLPNRLCYPEMVGKNYPLFFTTDSDFLSKIDKILDEPNFRKTHTDTLKSVVERLTWNNTVKDWFGGWDVFEFDKLTKDTPRYSDILKLIKNKGFVSKETLMDFLGWGVNISMSPYRNRLRDEPDIMLLKSGYQYKN
jgi:glycosyltransferase involved in cell wall biosynthesis